MCQQGSCTGHPVPSSGPEFNSTGRSAGKLKFHSARARHVLPFVWNLPSVMWKDSRSLQNATKHENGGHKAKQGAGGAAASSIILNCCALVSIYRSEDNGELVKILGKLGGKWHAN